jgi:cation-transporting ATPase F
VRVEPGDRVPADLRLTIETDVQVDESALTGESAPVVKDEVTLNVDTVVADRRNMLYSSTLVTRGSGAGVVVATGAATELGQIHRLVGGVDLLETPLTRNLAEFSRILTGIILGLAVATFLVGTARGEPWADMFTAAVALAVGAIPEGLPAAVTITLAIGVSRMARRRAVVRRLPAVETLGSTTVICTDKTGTLTQNEMTVVEVWTPARRYLVSGSGYSSAGSVNGVDGHSADLDESTAFTALLDVGVLCSDAHVSDADGTHAVLGDPTEVALLVLAEKAGYPVAESRSLWPRLDEVPFSSEEQCMRVQCGDGNRERVLAKGAVERVLELSTTQRESHGQSGPIDPDLVLEAANEMSSRGLRVLAAAEGASDASAVPLDMVDGLELVGLVGIEDLPRPAAATAVAACRRAGIAVKMVTGDHAGTATAVAGVVGVMESADATGVITGAQLSRLSDAELADQVDRQSVFARVSPQQKLRLVAALQARHHVVAMTGDGVNDAPALRQADIGVAMGSGTEVAKEAADMVLTDDDFATIEAAVEEGRGVFDNLTKFIVWTLPTNMGEGLVVLAAIVLGTKLPILPVQILWINMTTAVALGLMLAFEPKEPGIMERRPRDPQASLLSRALVERIVLVSTVLVLGSWWIFWWESDQGASVAEARTAAVNLFVVVAALYLVNCRSLTRPVWTLGWLSNRWVVGGIAVQALGQLLLTYLPVMNELFDTAPLPAMTWARILLVGLVSWLVVTADKAVRGSRFSS